MKNVIKHSKKGILMVTMMATLLSFANEGSFYSIENDASGTTLTLNSVKEGNLLSIKDNHGVTIYKESIQKSGTYIKGFDLIALPDGNYLFELEKDLAIKIIPFTVKANNVEFSKEEETYIYKPFTRVEGDMVLVSQLSLFKAPLEIEIFFSNHEYNYTGDFELVHSEVVEDTKNIQKIFKLSGINKGAYKLVYHTQGRTFSKVID